MTPTAFRAWRKHLGLSQSKAGEALGLSRATVLLYEAGKRREKPPRPVEIPRHVELACAALALGITKYQGPA